MHTTITSIRRRGFYGNITLPLATYQDRLSTLSHVRQAGITICSGGIIGMGENRAQRYGLLRELSSLNPHPESVPVNMLVPVEGTPLGNRPAEDPLELVRMIATARILMPKSMVRLSAGRLSLSDEAQALCFLAGANSVFLGEKLLTTPNPEADTDQALFRQARGDFANQSCLNILQAPGPAQSPVPRRCQWPGARIAIEAYRRNRSGRLPAAPLLLGL